MQVTVLSRDPDTGEAHLRIKPLHADRVRLQEGGVATPYSNELSEWEIRTTDLSLSFLGEDSQGQHDPGDPYLWTNTITVKHRPFTDGSQRMCELQAIPAGEIRYTTDSSSPRTSGQIYTAPFPIPNAKVMVLAFAAQDGVESETERFEIPKIDDVDLVKVDPHIPARWTRRFERDSTAETFALLDQLARYNASIGGLRIGGEAQGRYWEFLTDEGTENAIAEIGKMTGLMLELYPGRNVTISTTVLRFERGQDLIDLVADLKTQLKPNEVKQ